MSRRIEIPPPSLLDRVVGYLSPAAGLDRLRARTQLAMSGGYNGGQRSRRPTKRWRPLDRSADADTLGDLPDLRGRARELARNAPIATGALATVVTNVIGEGLQLQASIDAEALGLSEAQADSYEREHEREWRVFCRSADFTRVQDFARLQALAFRAALESGDAVAVRRFRKDRGDVYGTKIQLLEADRLSNPGRTADSDTIAGGVETDRDGVALAYHISDRHPGGLRVAGMKWERIPARAPDGRPVVLHLFDRTRPELTRGVPYLAPVIEHLKQIADYSDAEVTAAVVSAMFTLVIETTADESEQPVIGETDSALDDNEVKLGNGAVVALRPGEKANPVSPARPNANFDPFMQAFLRQVGVALELPFELLVKHFTASYSASRAALEMAWQFFRRQRAWFAAGFCQQIYGWFLEEAVASGRLARPGFFADPAIREAWCGAQWIGPSRASLNPKQEAEADEVDVRLGVKTREQICIERTGGEIEKKTAQLAKEAAQRRDAGLDAVAAAPTAEGPVAQDGADAPETDGDAEEDDTAEAPAAAAPVDTVRRARITRADGSVSEIEIRMAG